MNNGPKNTHFGREAGAAGADDELELDPQLETALRLALRSENAPAGFTERTMARALGGDRPTAVPPLPIEGSGKGKLLAWPQSRLWISGAVAAALLAGMLEGGLAVERVREQHRKIVQATQQFQTTERITVHALAQAREQLQRAGVSVDLD